MLFSIFSLKIFIYIIITVELLPALFALFNRKREKNKQIFPISIILPTRNEEKIVAEVIKKWLQVKYSEKIEIIFCDHSTDATPEIIKKWAKKYPFIKYLRTDTGSKLGNILEGIKHAKYPWVILHDADRIPEKDSIETLAPFLTENIGAVFGKILPRKTNSLFNALTGTEQVQKLIDQKFYSNIDSCPYITLSTCLARKKDFLNIKSQQIIADDIYLAMELRKKGLRCLLIHQSTSREEFVRNIGGLFKKRFRVSTGSSQMIFSSYLKNIGSKKYGLFGWLVIPIRLLYIIGFNLALTFYVLSLIIEGILGVIGFMLIIKTLLVVYLSLFLIYLFRNLILLKFQAFDKNFLYVTPLYPIYYLIGFRLISTIAMIKYIFGSMIIKKPKNSYWR